MNIDDMLLKPLLYRFTWTYTLCCLILAIVSYLLDEYADREIPGVNRTVKLSQMTE